MSIRVLGIDPGLTRCGWALVDRDDQRALRYIRSGVFRSATADDLAHRLHSIGSELVTLMEEDTPDLIALERVFSQQNLHTVISIAQLTGVVLFEAQKRHIPVQLYTPTQIKAAVTGYGKAEKKQVATMVTKILDLPGFSGPADESDALAIAISHHLQNPLLGQTLSKTSGSRLTAAQEKWLAAERQSRAK